MPTYTIITDDGLRITECVYDPDDDSYSVYGDKEEGVYGAAFVSEVIEED